MKPDTRQHLVENHLSSRNLELARLMHRARREAVAVALALAAADREAPTALSPRPAWEHIRGPLMRCQHCGRIARGVRARRRHENLGCLAERLREAGHGD